MYRLICFAFDDPSMLICLASSDCNALEEEEWLDKDSAQFQARVPLTLQLPATVKPAVQKAAH